MILTETETNALYAVRRSGSEGLAIGSGITASQAIRLEMLGLVRLTKDARQRAILTAKGASAARGRAA